MIARFCSFDLFGYNARYDQETMGLSVSFDISWGVEMQLSIDIPDELFLSINETPINLVQMVKQKLALELYKNHKISISQGAKFIGMDIYSFMRILNEHHIPAIDDYDIEAEIDALKELWVIIGDSSALIALAVVDQLGLLEKLYGNLLAFRSH